MERNETERWAVIVALADASHAKIQLWMFACFKHFTAHVIALDELSRDIFRVEGGDEVLCGNDALKKVFVCLERKENGKEVKNTLTPRSETSRDAEPVVQRTLNSKPNFVVCVTEQ